MRDIEHRRRAALAAAASLALSGGLAACGDEETPVEPGGGNAGGSAKPERLARFATVPLGAEITGLEVSPNGDLFFNVQHPDDSNIEPYNLATIGVVEGLDINALPEDFTALELPASMAQKQAVRVAAGDYEILGQEEYTYAGALPFGLGVIVSADGSMTVKASNDPDFNAFVPANEQATAGYLFTNWEDRPGGMSRLKLRKAGDGSWSVEDALMLDFGGVAGTWVNCFGTLSPWGTPLSAEELYFDETSVWNDPAYDDFGHQTNMQRFTDYLGGVYPNPYRIGYIVEIKDPTGTATPVKHYALGRMSHENGVVMPDRRTVYLTSDGAGQGFFKFVADSAGELSSGTLYAAKLTQDGNGVAAETAFDIEWVELASASNAEIESWIAEYDGIDQSDFTPGSTSYLSDAEIADWAAGTAPDARAAFLETTKAAAARGATVEFNKMEGININYAAAADGSVPYMYVAMSEVDNTMADGTGDIRLEAHPCGVVYRMELDADYNVNRMEPMVAGGEYDAGDAAYPCPAERISNPDNLVVLADGRVIIGEDSGEHENNMLWIWSPAEE